MNNNIKNLFSNINFHEIPFFDNVKNTIVFIDNICCDDLSDLDNDFLSISNFQTNEKQVINVNVNKSLKDCLHFAYIGTSCNNNKFELNINLNNNVKVDIFFSFIDNNKSDINGIINFILNSNTDVTTKVLYINNHSSNYRIDIVNYHISSNSIYKLIAKGVLYEDAVVDFNMKIVADKFLKSILSSELHKVLKLSNTAAIRSVPAIICSTPDTEIHHGFALSGIDKSSINFLKSRGINQTDSESVLINAFVSSI